MTKYFITIFFLLSFPLHIYSQANTWKQHSMNGGFGIIKINPSEPNNIYAQSYGSLHYSSNKGMTWANIDYSYLSSHFEEVFFDYADKEHIFIVSKTLGILETFDGGKSFGWNNDGIDLVDRLPPPFGLNSIIQNPAYSNEFILTGREIYRSSNSGRSWFKILSKPYTYFDAPLYDIKNPDLIYCLSIPFWGGATQLIQSTDYGLTWSVVSSGLSISHRMFQHPDGTLYNCNNVSTDRGKTWIKMQYASTSSRSYSGEKILKYEYDYKAKLLYAIDSYDGLLKTKHGSNKWDTTFFSFYSYEGIYRRGTDIAIDTLHNRIYIVNNDSLFISENGGAFIPVSSKLFFPTVQSVVPRGINGDTLISLLPYPVYIGRSSISFDKGRTWNDILGELIGEGAAFLPHDDFLLAKTVYFTLLCSFDYGKSFRTITTHGVLPYVIMGTNKLTPEYIYGGCVYGLWRTTKEQLLTAQPESVITYLTRSLQTNQVRAMDFHPRDSNTIYMINSRGSLTNNIYKTTNLGISWQLIIDTTIYHYQYRSIAVDQKNPDRIYVAHMTGIIYTHDGGTTWNEASGPEFDGSYGRSSYFISIVTDKRRPNYIYAACRTHQTQVPPDEKHSGGVFYSSDYGRSWQLMNMDGLLHKDVLSLCYLNDPPRIIASTMGGAYEYLLPDTPDDVEMIKNSESTFELSQIYPHPVFANSTQTYSIHYYVAKTENVLIKIYDGLGRIVRTIVDGAVDEGDHQAQFSANGLHPGIYFIRMRSGKYFSSKKFLVLN